MTPGESKTEKVPCQLAFGPDREELRCRVERSWPLAQDVKAEVGLGLEIRRTDGEVMHMRIVELNGDTVTLDANHRLAGEDLILHVALLAIPERPVSGVPGNGRSSSRVT
jgi:peptidylprolyl isomerase